VLQVRQVRGPIVAVAGVGLMTMSCCIARTTFWVPLETELRPSCCSVGRGGLFLWAPWAGAGGVRIIHRVGTRRVVWVVGRVVMMCCTVRTILRVSLETELRPSNFRVGWGCLFRWAPWAGADGVPFIRLVCTRARSRSLPLSSRPTSRLFVLAIPRIHSCPPPVREEPVLGCGDSQGRGSRGQGDDVLHCTHHPLGIAGNRAPFLAPSRGAGGLFPVGPNVLVLAVCHSSVWCAVVPAFGVAGSPPGSF
jgi:hypothetical protein